MSDGPKSPPFQKSTLSKSPRKSTTFKIPKIKQSKNLQNLLINYDLLLTTISKASFET